MAAKQAVHLLEQSLEEAGERAELLQTRALIEMARELDFLRRQNTSLQEQMLRLQQSVSDFRFEDFNSKYPATKTI